MLVGAFLSSLLLGDLKVHNGGAAGEPDSESLWADVPAAMPTADVPQTLGGAAGAVNETDTPDAVPAMELPAMGLRPELLQPRDNPAQIGGAATRTAEPAYSLAFPSLAHWNQERVYMTLLMGMPFSRSLARLNANCPPHRWCANSRATSSICSVTGECASGRAELHFAPEEGFSQDPAIDPIFDRGQSAWFAEYQKAHGIHGEAPFHFSTVSARCRAPTAAAGAAGSVRVSVDGTFSVEQPLQALPAPSQVSRVRGKPVVCGRVLAGTLAGDMLARSVRLNVQQGVAVVVMYELGVPRIERRVLLAELQRSSSLVIVDLRDVFQDLFGHYASLTAVTSFAFSQWLARYDCMNRVRPLRPSWVAFFNTDELPFAGIDVPASTSLPETLQALPADIMAARFQTFCPFLPTAGAHRTAVRRALEGRKNAR
jgi:hypothetical protein